MYANIYIVINTKHGLHQLNKYIKRVKKKYANLNVKKFQNKITYEDQPGLKLISESGNLVYGN